MEKLSLEILHGDSIVLLLVRNTIISTTMFTTFIKLKPNKNFNNNPISSLFVNLHFLCSYSWACQSTLLHNTSYTTLKIEVIPNAYQHFHALVFTKPWFGAQAQALIQPQYSKGKPKSFCHSFF